MKPYWQNCGLQPGNGPPNQGICSSFVQNHFSNERALFNSPRNDASEEYPLSIFELFNTSNDDSCTSDDSNDFDQMKIGFIEKY